MTDIERALRDAFPHFQDDAPITPDAIRSIGREYLEMVMGWEPAKTEIEFADHDGNFHKIVYDSGDDTVGISSGWILDEASELAVRSACEACDGKGYIPRTIHVYEPGCGFSHPDVAEDTCQACGGNGWFVCEAEGDQ